jgi:hypothetical protein
MPNCPKKHPCVPVNYLLIVCFLLAACEAQRQIVIDHDLVSNSERWKASVKYPMFYISSNSLGKSFFGPFRTTAYEKLDSPKLKTSSHKSISFHLFRRDETFSQRRVYTLDVAGLSDTAHVLYFLWSSFETSEPGFFSKQESKRLNATRDGYGEIRTNNDTVPWRFSVELYKEGYEDKQDISKGTCGYLSYELDTIAVNPVFELTGSKSIFDPVGKKGVILTGRTGKTLAGLQLMEHNFVWIRNDLPANTRLAIAAFFVAMLGSEKW